MQVTTSNYLLFIFLKGNFVKTFYAAFLYKTTFFWKLIVAKCAYSFVYEMK